MDEKPIVLRCDAAQQKFRDKMLEVQKLLILQGGCSLTLQIPKSGAEYVDDLVDTHRSVVVHCILAAPDTAKVKDASCVCRPTDLRKLQDTCSDCDSLDFGAAKLKAPLFTCNACGIWFRHFSSCFQALPALCSSPHTFAHNIQKENILSSKKDPSQNDSLLTPEGMTPEEFQEYLQNATILDPIFCTVFFHESPEVMNEVISTIWTAVRGGRAPAVTSCTSQWRMDISEIEERAFDVDAVHADGTIEIMEFRIAEGALGWETLEKIRRRMEERTHAAENGGSAVHGQTVIVMTETDPFGQGQSTYDCRMGTRGKNGIPVPSGPAMIYTNMAAFV